VENYMQRRDFIALLGGVFSWPFLAHARQKAIPVIGCLHVASPGPFPFGAGWVRRLTGKAGEHDRRRGEPVTRLSLAFLVLVLANYGARAAEKSYRLGDLEPTAASAEITRNTIVPELAKLGFEEGTNLVIDERVGDDTAMPGLAEHVILSRPDAIIAFGTAAILAAHKASATIPIVTFGPTRSCWVWPRASPDSATT
jgi:hypothetical protein